VWRFGIPVVGYTDGLMRITAETTAAQPRTLRRAIAFIHENAHRDIGLSDIAAAISVTPRSVQYIFRRHLGTTPLEYLRRVRLDRAHRDLQAADPSVDTVMAIAGRWRFGHAGRFSIAYRKAFGTPPSQTLRA
jgi:transcriptional regulator GlxA family with amidase domain